MLLRGTTALADAAMARRAIPGFVAYNMETVQAIVAAAEQTDRPVLLQAGSSAFRYAGRNALIAIALSAAERSRGRIGVHLDHSRDLDEISACIDAGYTSVMVDGSHLPLRENIALTRAVVSRAHDAGVWVEAELGAVAGDEDVSTDAVADAMTDPGAAADFVAATGVDALAVAVGNVHGFSRAKVRLDLERLAAINEALAGKVPLVLHGASGLPPDQLLAALERGVAKVNVNAELRRAYLAASEQHLPAAREADDLVTPLAAARAAVRDTAARLISLLAPKAASS